MITRTCRTVIVAAAVAVTAVSVSAQERAQFTGDKYLGPLHGSQHIGVTARVGRLDERIALLTADMRMFAGELKIQVMADLIEALIERQSLVERKMRPTQEMMDEWMPHAKKPAPPATVPDSEEFEPATMCSPYI